MVPTILICSAPVLTGLAVLLVSVFTLTPQLLALALTACGCAPLTHAFHFDRARETV
ncbi:hypothetical protein ACH4TQ_47035 [Streptomyces sp. NPDC021218]|uniref:hypothetical protein n=1 Tax=Streptomyces sp. NPDC021218 TaxID=3365119 RepID=UPI003793C9C9